MKKSAIWLCVLACLSQPVFADGFFSDLFGIEKASGNVKDSAQIVKEGLDSMGIQLDETARNLPLATNFYGLLVSDFHSNDKERSDKAKRIIQSTFGDIIKKGAATPLLEVSVYFSGADTSKHPLRASIVFIDNDSKQHLASLEHTIINGRNYKFETIHSNPTTTPVLAADIENKVNERYQVASDLIYRMNNDYPVLLKGESLQHFGSETGMSARMQKGYKNVLEDWFRGKPVDISSLAPPSDPNGLLFYAEKYRGYLKRKLADELTKTTMLPSEQFIDLPTKDIISRDYDGGYYAVLIMPEEDYQAHKESGAKMYLTQHVHGSPNQPVREFKDSPQQITWKALGHRPSIKTQNPDFPTVRMNVVSLQLSNLVQYDRVSTTGN